MDDEIIRKYLLRRGGKIISFNPENFLLLPLHADEGKKTEFYNLLKDSMFRKFLREIIKLKKGFTEDDIKKSFGTKRSKSFLKKLKAIEVIRNIDVNLYEISNQEVRSFGDTFEWFIAEIFQRELFSTSAFGIKVRGVSLNGDIDVFSIVEGYSIYVEVKSSPPRNVELCNIEAFLSRISTLSSNMAIFLEDTELRMEDKIVPLFQDAILKRNAKKNQKRKKMFEITRIQNEIWTLQRKLYITNAYPDIVANLCFCVRDFLCQQGIFWL